MAQIVVQGASCMCTFGATPATLNPTSQAVVKIEQKTAATIQDCQTMNLPTFGMCMSLANPAVASATAAALGVLTPQPCQPVPLGTWIPTKPTVMVGGKPVLCSDSKLMCAFAGSISVVFPGQVKVTV